VERQVRGDPILRHPQIDHEGAPAVGRGLRETAQDGRRLLTQQGGRVAGRQVEDHDVRLHPLPGVCLHAEGARPGTPNPLDLLAEAHPPPGPSHSLHQPLSDRPDAARHGPDTGVWEIQGDRSVESVGPRCSGLGADHQLGIHERTQSFPFRQPRCHRAEGILNDGAPHPRMPPQPGGCPPKERPSFTSILRGPGKPFSREIPKGLSGLLLPRPKGLSRCAEVRAPFYPPPLSIRPA